MTKIVMPGEIVSDRPVRMAYAYSDGQKTYSTVVGMLSQEGKLIPLEGPYEPLPEDYVVGYVSDVRFAGYSIDIGTANPGSMSSRDSREKFSLGDMALAKIIAVDEVKNIDLADARKLAGGRIEKISPVKVPRLIGKKNSMITMIADATGCQIVVGRNGYVFISHKGDHKLACEAVEMIEREAHTSGLTDRVAAYMKERKAQRQAENPALPQQ